MIEPGFAAQERASRLEVFHGISGGLIDFFRKIWKVGRDDEFIRRYDGVPCRLQEIARVKRDNAVDGMPRGVLFRDGERADGNIRSIRVNGASGTGVSGMRFHECGCD